MIFMNSQFFVEDKRSESKNEGGIEKYSIV